MMVNRATILPDGFISRLRRIVPEERVPEVMRSFEVPRGAGFRINSLLAGQEEVVARLEAAGLHPIACPWTSTGYWVPAGERGALLASQPFAAHHIYVQNVSSMLPPALLGPLPGERVVDLAAAPGSKTLQMACMMEGVGELAAVELVRARFFKMRALLECHGAAFVRTFLQNGERVWKYRPEYFDRVLLDAPCTTEGRFHVSDPSTFAYWRPRKIKEMVRKQRRLLFSAIHALRPGGVLVYSTCTFAPEENEAVVDWALEKFGSAVRAEPTGLTVGNSVSPLEEWEGRRFGDGVSQSLRILPDERMEAFFLCRIRKTASTRP